MEPPNDLGTQQLFDPFEDQFDLPPRSVQLKDLLRRPLVIERGYHDDHAQIEALHGTELPAFRPQGARVLP